jgi:transcription elongation GreA/GreB family factor
MRVLLIIDWNHVETISSNEDDALSCTSINRTNQSTDIITTIRRSLSTNNNENLRQEFESIDENDNEIGLNRDEDRIQQIIPKRRQSRVISSNNKVRLDL